MEYSLPLTQYDLDEPKRRGIIAEPFIKILIKTIRLKQSIHSIHRIKPAVALLTEWRLIYRYRPVWVSNLSQKVINGVTIMTTTVGPFVVYATSGSDVKNVYTDGMLVPIIFRSLIFAHQSGGARGGLVGKSHLPPQNTEAVQCILGVVATILPFIIGPIWSTEPLTAPTDEPVLPETVARVVKHLDWGSQDFVMNIGSGVLFVYILNHGFWTFPKETENRYYSIDAVLFEFLYKSERQGLLAHGPAWGLTLDKLLKPNIVSPDLTKWPTTFQAQSCAHYAMTNKQLFPST